jgi:hypothetical protein
MPYSDIYIQATPQAQGRAKGGHLRFCAAQGQSKRRNIDHSEAIPITHSVRICWHSSRCQTYLYPASHCHRYSQQLLQLWIFPPLNPLESLQESYSCITGFGQSKLLFNAKMRGPPLDGRYAKLLENRSSWLQPIQICRVTHRPTYVSDLPIFRVRTPLNSPQISPFADTFPILNHLLMFRPWRA